MAVFDQRGPPAWFLAVAKVQIPVKIKLWVRDLIHNSEGKHQKTKLESLQKKEDNKSSQKFSLQPLR
jgi:hypothetical protein